MSAGDGVAVAALEVPEPLALAGLSLHLDAVSEAEETALLALIDSQPWDATLKRRTQHYGCRFDFRRKTVDPSAAAPPVPAGLGAIVRRLLAAEPPLLPWGRASSPERLQVTIIEYPPGIGIAPHVDTHSAFADGIGALTLGAGVAFRMQQREAAADYAVWLPERSLLVMRGAARYAWRHSISSRRHDRVEAPPTEGAGDAGCEWRPRGRRVSVTLRLVLDGEGCSCAWPQWCDSQGGVAIELPTRLRPDAPMCSGGEQAREDGAIGDGEKGHARPERLGAPLSLHSSPMQIDSQQGT
ncbi:hypothetical protein AB1Y20_001123 [Prymnesium parvum]|uniref:Fe2OG dioxygenase domain-containing protein n=1 Tax=Prymnesium parvum TaxID=97485 RepID=A0AB34K6U7_PRYPA